MSVISTIRSLIVTVSDKTKWNFVVLTTSDGISGIGEATAFGREDELAEAITQIGGRLKGQLEKAIDTLVIETEADGFIDRAVVSALEQACWDIKGKRAGKPVHELLGDSQRQRIPVYANINRRTTDRTPEGFAKSAAEAVARGHRTIKIAPFDGLTPEMDSAGNALFEAGVERIAATRAAIPPDTGIMVDCHWRLSHERTRKLLIKADDLGLYWVECPLPEDPDNTANLEQLKQLKNDTGVRLAGAEKGTNAAYFEKLMAAEIYDVIMPDVKYAGGLAATVRIAEQSARQNVAFSPHNPSGPVCHLASLHVSAVVPNLLMLEVQFDESPLFDNFFPDSVPIIENGYSALPAGPGLGINMDDF